MGKLRVEELIKRSAIVTAAVTEYGWGEHEEGLLAAARETERRYEMILSSRRDAIVVFTPFEHQAAEVRHVLVAMKLLCHGSNPYLGRMKEWIKLAEHDAVRYQWARDHAKFWLERQRRIAEGLTG